jgi:nitrogen fixation protein FixH
MNPFWFALRVAGVTVLTVGGVTYAMSKAASRSCDVVGGAAHFRRGFEEFQKGFEKMFLGTRRPTPEEAKKQKEAKRIPIS